MNAKEAAEKIMGDAYFPSSPYNPLPIKTRIMEIVQQAIDSERNEYYARVAELEADNKRLKKLVAMMEPDHKLMCLRRGQPDNDEYVRRLQKEHGWTDEDTQALKGGE